MQNVADAFFDAFGDSNFAFAGEQLDRAHFAHIHTHGVGGAAGFVLHRGQNGSGFFGGEVIVAGFWRFLTHEVVSGRRALVHRDAQVIEHLNDVFDLLAFSDRFRKVIVHLAIGQIALIFAALDELGEQGVTLCLIQRHIVWSICVLLRWIWRVRLFGAHVAPRATAAK